MKGSIISTVGTLLSVFVVTQAEVLVTIFDGGGDVACGQKVTLMCEVRSDTGIMTWEIGGTAVALCTLGTCDTDSTTFPDISFSFDTDSDVYNISIDPIAISYNGIRVKCDDGESFNSQTLSVTVPPSADTSFIESSSNHTRTLISVSTGCITNRENINVTWFYYKEDESLASFPDQGILSDTDRVCSDELCGGSGVTSVTRSIPIEADPDGESFYVEARIQYPGMEDIVHTFERPFVLKDPAPKARGDKVNPCGLFRFLLAIMLAIVLYD